MNPYPFVLFVPAGWINYQQQDVIQYLQEEYQAQKITWYPSTLALFVPVPVIQFPEVDLLHAPLP